MVGIQKLRAGVLASSLVLAGFSGTGLQLTALSAGGVLVLAGEAYAQTTIPGVGTVVKKKPGNSAIANGASDDNGEVVFKSLEAGEYTVTVGRNRPQSFTIGEGGGGIKVTVVGTKEKYEGIITPLR